MTVSYELDLNSFEAWSGAVDTLDRIRREDKIEECEQLLEELYPDGMDETQLNDLLWFDDEWLLDSLGIRTYDKIKEELDDKKEELEDLKEEYQEELNYAKEEDYTAEYIDKIEESFSVQIESLEEEIAELEEELENA